MVAEIAMPEQDDRWRTRAEQALEQGDLISAALLVERHAGGQSLEPDTSILVSRVMWLRGRYTEAQAALEQALASAPGNVSVLVEYARIARELGEPLNAHAWFERAWGYTSAFAPWVPEWLDILIQLSQHETAFQIANTHAGRAQDDAAAWFWLGYVLHLNQQLGAAFNAYHRCADLAPQWPMLRNNLAALYLDLHNYPAARTQIELALKADPLNPLAWTNLSVSWLRQGEPAAARVAVERALALNPRYPLAWQTCSNVLEALREWDGAEEAIKRARILEPDHEGFRLALARLQLMRGEYRDGWINYEARLMDAPQSCRIAMDGVAPRWHGEPAPRKTILVWSDSGEAEALQFARFVPELARRVRAMGGEVVLAILPALVSLFRLSLGDEVRTVVALHPDAIPPHDVQIPLGSVPLALDIALDDLRDYRPPYMTADLTWATAWRERCATTAQAFKVGLVWRNEAQSPRPPSQMISPTMLAAVLAGIETVEYYSLQESVLPAEKAAFHEAQLALVTPMTNGLTFAETAAFVSQLDLVIAVSGSIAHLAGAVSVPVWLLLDVHPDWVWMADREDSPWYPSVRVYRQCAFGQWQPVLEALAHDLRAHVRCT
jgi:tetratricopeptide (TPR) repeat protein